MSARRHVGAIATLAAVLAATGCGSSSLPYMQQRNAMRALGTTGAGKIRHIVFIVQENRSFNSLFMGYPGALTVSSGRDSKGETVRLRPIGLTDQYIVDHSDDAMFAACDGMGPLPGTVCRMDGFDKELAFGGPKLPEYVYVRRSDTKPYWAMAHEWTLADEMFPSQLDESFVAHQYVIAAQAAWSVDLPNGTWGCGGKSWDSLPTITAARTHGSRVSPCFDYETLGDELDSARLSWRFYASKYGTASSGRGAVWSSYQAVKHIYEGPDWKKVISPNWQFIIDVRRGKLADFTWITPTCKTSDHVNCGGGLGPSWVAALVDTIGKSKFWDSTAIFVMWDEWGGLYDPVSPPYEDRAGLGFRVPLIVISPYAKQNYVSHVQYETASVLRFAEDLWGLPRLAASDARANSPAADCFDFSQGPQRFLPIKAPEPPGFFIHRRSNDYFAPDYE